MTIDERRAAYVTAYRAAYAAAAREITTLVADTPDAADVDEIASAWRNTEDAARDAVNDLVRLISSDMEERESIDARALDAAAAAIRAA